MRTDVAKLVTTVHLDGKKIADGKVEDDQLVLSFKCRAGASAKEIVVRVSHGDEVLVEKTLDAITSADIRSLDSPRP